MIFTCLDIHISEASHSGGADGRTDGPEGNKVKRPTVEKYCLPAPPPPPPPLSDLALSLTPTLLERRFQVFGEGRDFRTRLIRTTTTTEANAQQPSLSSLPLSRTKNHSNKCCVAEGARPPVQVANNLSLPPPPPKEEEE